MFNYHLHIIEHCIDRLNQRTQSRFKRFYLITMIVLCTELPCSIAFPFETKFQVKARISFPLTYTYLIKNEKSLWKIDYLLRHPDFLINKELVYNNGRAFPPVFLEFGLPVNQKNKIPKNNISFLYQRPNNGVFSRIFEKISPMMPHGPPWQAPCFQAQNKLNGFIFLNKTIVWPYAYYSIRPFFMNITLAIMKGGDKFILKNQKQNHKTRRLK